MKWRADLRRLSERLRDPERTDALTGLLNRVAFVEAAEREWRLAERGTLETYVLAFRISNLGQISRAPRLRGRRADAEGCRRRDAERHPPHRPRRPARRRRVRRGARGLQGARGRRRVHRALRAGAPARDPRAPRAARAHLRDLLARRCRVARGRSRRESRPRPGTPQCRSPGRPREHRGRHRHAAAPQGRRPALGARRPLGLPERRDRRAGLRDRGRGRGGGARGAQRKHRGAGAGRVRRHQRGAARARDRRALRDRLHRPGQLRGGLGRRRDDQAVGGQALPGGAGWVRRRRPARGDDRPRGLARRERHRRDDEARGAAGRDDAPGLDALLDRAGARGRRRGRRRGRGAAQQARRVVARCSGRRTRPMARDGSRICRRSRLRRSSAPATRRGRADASRARRAAPQAGRAPRPSS